MHTLNLFFYFTMLWDYLYHLYPMESPKIEISQYYPDSWGYEFLRIRYMIMLLIPKINKVNVNWLSWTLKLKDWPLGWACVLSQSLIHYLAHDFLLSSSLFYIFRKYERTFEIKEHLSCDINGFFQFLFSICFINMSVWDQGTLIMWY